MKQQDEPRLEVVPDHIDFAAEERKILQKWRDKNTFQTSLEFVFFKFSSSNFSVEIVESLITHSMTALLLLLDFHIMGIF